MKIVTYILVSTILSSFLVFYAIYTREQFYPVVLFLSSSKISFILNVNMLMALGIFMAKLFNHLFLGNLRDAEVEMLIDRGKFAITETCLAFTIFRNEFTYPIISLFVLLLILKSFHWLAKSRIEYIDQVMPTSIWVYSKLGLYVFALLIFDSILCYLCVQFTIQHGNNSLILFGFEFGLLVISIINTAARFVLLIYDQQFTNEVSFKGVLVMITDLICDGIRFLIYICFFGLVFSYYGMPIHLIREVFVAFQIFQKKLISFIRYLQLSKNLESLEPATAEEIQVAGDCLICRESMSAAKKLSCGHIFHLDCLRMWLQHQQSCPLCRADILLRPTTGSTSSQTPRTPVDDPVNNANDNNAGQQGDAPVHQPAVGANIVQRGLIAYIRRRFPDPTGERSTETDQRTTESVDNPKIETNESSRPINHLNISDSISPTSSIGAETSAENVNKRNEISRRRQEYFSQQKLSPVSASILEEANNKSISTDSAEKVKISQNYIYQDILGDDSLTDVQSKGNQPEKSAHKRDAYSISESKENTGQGFPAFYYVARSSNIFIANSSASSSGYFDDSETSYIYKEHNFSSEIVRKVLKGAIVFVLSRWTDDSSTLITWLQVPDGWIIESSYWDPVTGVMSTPDLSSPLNPRIKFLLPYTANLTAIDSFKKNARNVVLADSTDPIPLRNNICEHQHDTLSYLPNNSFRSTESESRNNLAYKSASFSLRELRSNEQVAPVIHHHYHHHYTENPQSNNLISDSDPFRATVNYVPSATAFSGHAENSVPSENLQEEVKINHISKVSENNMLELQKQMIVMNEKMIELQQSILKIQLLFYEALQNQTSNPQAGSIEKRIQEMKIEPEEKGNDNYENS